MAHQSENIISKILLPNGVEYEICDPNAIHSADELGIAGVLKFKGTKETLNDLLSLLTAEVGDVWLVTDTNTEYVCIEAVVAPGQNDRWEALGNVHDAASSTHIHHVGVTGTNEASAVTGKVTVPTISSQAMSIQATTTTEAPVRAYDDVLGADTTFNVSGGTTTKLKATASGVTVAGNGTANAITGFGDHTTASAITALDTATIKNPTVTAVSIPNVTDNAEVTASKVTASAVTASKISENTDVKATKMTSYGSAASWTASVAAGVLSFAWTPNEVAAGTEVTASKVTASDVTASSVTATDVKASKVTMGTALSASQVTTANVTVATGAKATANAITALGTPVTAAALTGVKVETQPTITLSTGETGDVTVATDISDITVTAGDNDRQSVLKSYIPGETVVKLENCATAEKPDYGNSVNVVYSVSVGSAEAELVNGIAAAQNWTGSASVSKPSESTANS